MQVVVTILIAGTLVGLVTPAVLKARAVARRNACQDRLRQLGLAATDYTDRHAGQFPSRLMDLLPAIDQEPAYKSLREYEAATRRDVEEKGFSQRPRPTGIGANSQLVCSEDRFVDPLELQASYYMNGGTEFRKPAPRPAVANGIHGLNPEEPARLSDIPDGTSNTALYSERLHPDINELPWPARRYAWPLAGVAATPDDLFQLYQRQAEWANDGTPSDLVRQVSRTAMGDVLTRHTRYDHILPPNSRPVFDQGLRDRQRVSLPATAMHGGGVNVAFCDGHVSFVSDDIDLVVWRAIGTRNGREVVDNTDF